MIREDGAEKRRIQTAETPQKEKETESRVVPVMFALLFVYSDWRLCSRKIPVSELFSVQRNGRSETNILDWKVIRIWLWLSTRKMWETWRV